LRRRDRKQRPRAERWYRKRSRALCSSDLLPSLEGAPGWGDVKKLRRNGAAGGDAPPLAARANGVHRRVTRGFMAWAGEDCGGQVTRQLCFQKSSPKLPKVVAASLLPWNSARVHPRAIVLPPPEHSPSPHQALWRHRLLAHADFLTRLPTLLYP
jgi:hypothetical protein